MSDNSTPLIQTLGMAAVNMDFIGAGYAGLVVKNGRLVRQLQPGRHFNFSLPIFDRCHLILVDTKIRQLEIKSNSDFLSFDQFLMNISLGVMYQVVNPQRVALELSDPLSALVDAIKDELGIVIGQNSLQQLLSVGRSLIRQELLSNAQSASDIGFRLTDVRVHDVSFPQSRGVIRQVEGMSAREEAENQAALKVQIAAARRPVVQPQIPAAPVQQVHIISNHPSTPPASPPLVTEAHLIEPGESPRGKLLPTERRSTRPILAPTTLEDSSQTTPGPAFLVNESSGEIVSVEANPFTIGREPDNHLVLQDSLCSRYHAKICQARDETNVVRYQLIDVGSSNGTFVEGQRLTAHQPFWLSQGDEIKMGNQKWTFQA